MSEKETFRLSVAVSKDILEDMATESIFEYIEDIYQYEPDAFGHYYLALISAYGELARRFNHAKEWAQGELDKAIATNLGHNHE